MSSPPVSLIVLAGGESRRMGQPKALLPVPGSGEPLIRHVIRRLITLVGEELIVVTNTPAIGQAVSADFAASVLADAWPDTGPLGGVATGLSMATGWAIVVACDLPLVNPRLFQYLCRLTQERQADDVWRWQAIAPVVDGRAQPLHALYHPSAIPAIQQQLACGELSMNRLLSLVRTRWVEEAELRPYDEDLHSFMNVNTPAQWQRACDLL